VSQRDYGNSRAPALSRNMITILETSPVAVVAVDSQGQYIYGNRSAEDLVGYERRDLYQHHMLDLLQVGPEWYQSEFQRFVQEQAWSGNASIRAADGAPLQTRINAFVGSTVSGDQTYVAFLHRSAAAENGTDVLLRETFPFGLDHPDFRLLSLMAEGFADKEIAELLGKSVWTVNRNVHDLMRKMDVSSRTEACVIALKRALIY
jgi:PAS domain S-box-containing protein